MIPHRSLILSYLKRKLLQMDLAKKSYNISTIFLVVLNDLLGKRLSRSVSTFFEFMAWEKNFDYLFRTNGTGQQRCLSEYFSSFLLFLVPQQLYYLRGDEKKPQVLKMHF